MLKLLLSLQALRTSDKLYDIWSYHLSPSQLIQRAADLEYAPRYFGIFCGFEFFRFERESTLPPQAANAHRWAALLSKCYAE